MVAIPAHEVRHEVRGCVDVGLLVIPEHNIGLVVCAGKFSIIAD